MPQPGGWLAGSGPEPPWLAEWLAGRLAAGAAAALNFLNIAASSINPFWRKDSIELLPGRYAVPDGAGVDVLRASTDQGIELVMTKKFDPLTFQTLYTLDTLYGVVMTNPEMAGILLFNQT